jgi:hypothetical protein
VNDHSRIGQATDNLRNRAVIIHRPVILNKDDLPLAGIDRKKQSVGARSKLSPWLHRKISDLTTEPACDWNEYGNLMADSNKVLTSRSIQCVRRLDLFSPWNRDQILGASFSALCALAIFLSSFFISGTHTPIGELDPSWQAVLEFAMQNRLQFGSEIIFTYGPLGFLFQPYGFGMFPSLRSISALAFSGVVAFAALNLALRIRGIAKFLFLFWLLLFPSYMSGITELVFVYLIAIFVGFVLLDATYNRCWVKRFLLFYVCALALVKFSFFVPILFLLVICAIDRICSHDREGARELVACSVISFVFLWLVLGQSLEGFFQYLWASQQIASGYTEAMSLAPRARVLKYALPAAVFFLFALAVTGAIARQKRHVIAPAMIIILFSFTAWKQGFVRADGHVLMFLYFLPVAYGFLFTLAFSGSIPGAVRTGLLLGYFAVAGLCLMAANAIFPGLPLAQTRSLGERLLANSRSLIALLTPASSLPGRFPKNLRVEDRLPRIVQRVGDSSIDVFNYRQGAALLNDLKYHPRPVIQSYSAYTPDLLRANLDFYRRPSRPSYVLFSLETIDGRFPTLDDALLLPCILANYQPVLAEHHFLLMERTPGPPRNVSYDRVYSASLDMGQKLDMTTWNNSPLFLRVSTTPTLIGRILTLLYQPPAYKLEVELDEGGKRDFRFIPGMASEGFLMNPLLENNGDVIDLLMDENQKRVKTVAILPVRGSIAGLKVPITVEVYQSSNFLPSSRSENVVRQSAARMKYPMFSVPPVFVKGAVPVQPAMLEESPGLLVHAPGVMVFEVPAGTQQLSGAFGILEEAYTNNGKTDGVEFIVAIENENGAVRQALGRLLRPQENVAERGKIRFNVALDRKDRKVFLKTAVGQHQDEKWDWSVWSDIEFR